jgi:hypothetical protein
MAEVIGTKQRSIDVETNGQRLIYRMQREYLVYDESGSATENDILLAVDVPRVNTIENDAGVPALMICKGKSAKIWENNKKYWTVTADFDNEPQDTEQDTGGDESGSQDPTTWFAIVDFTFETFELAKPNVVNFAKRPYASVPSVTELIPVLKFTQYLPQQLSIYDLITDYHNVTNSTDFLNAPPYYWLLTIADAKFGTTNGFKCWKVDFELRFKATRLPPNSSVYWIGPTTGIAFSESPNIISGEEFYPGWCLYLPQVDTMDINKQAFADLKENNGEFGKLDTDGTFLTDQTVAPYIIQEDLYRIRDFSFLRIKQN